MHAPRHTHPLPPPLDPRNRHTTSPSSSELTRLFPPFLPPPSLPCSYLRPSARASTACASTAANPAAVPRPLLGPPPPDLWHSRADSQGSRSQEAHEPSGSAQGVDARQAWWCAPGSPLHCLTNATSSPLGFRHTGATPPSPRLAPTSSASASRSRSVPTHASHLLRHARQRVVLLRTAGRDSVEEARLRSR